MTDLPAPRMEMTRLASNGLRVASQETYGELCNFGVFMDGGSRTETHETTGATQLMELMAFKSTLRRSHEQIHMDIADLGGTTTSFATRDLLMMNIEVLRENLEPAMEVLGESLLIPQITVDEVEEMKTVMALQLDQLPPETLMREAIHEAAFGRDSILGRPHYCPPDLIGNLNPRVLVEHRAQYLQGPRMVLVGAGVEQAQFVTHAEQYFGHIPPGTPSSDAKELKAGSPYRGGEVRWSRQLPQNSEFTHVGLAWMSSWDTIDDRVPLCVMQVLLGGGNSFSAGGPGKGMYSRLYRQVLNRHMGIDSAEAHVEASGLFGIMGSCTPNYAEELVYAFSQQFAKLCYQKADDEELSRAKNMLKCNVLTCLESPHMVFEDIGQQLLGDDAYMTPAEVCARIDDVTADDLVRVASAALSHGPPSVACTGSDISYVPSQDTVKTWFRM